MALTRCNANQRVETADAKFFNPEGRHMNLLGLGLGNLSDRLSLATPRWSVALRILGLPGTTALTFKFHHGVIVATDSGATVGAFIVSQTRKKVKETNPYLLGCVAGGIADCSFL